MTYEAEKSHANTASTPRHNLMNGVARDIARTFNALREELA
jgi:hypothetical protein